MPSFELARFHHSTGPASLFERVRFVFRRPRELKLNATHFRERAELRTIPVRLLENFDSSRWELMTVEVRTDTGKFVKTGWRGDLDGERWWLVLGYNDTVQTAFPSNKEGDGPDIVRGGKVHAFVANVNHELMVAERATPMAPRNDDLDE